MKNVVFNVKENSINEFFEISEREQRERCSPMGAISAYHLMKDEIFISRSKIGERDTQVKFELTDWSNGSQKSLVNTYLYDVCEYDSLKLKLKLVDFKINIVK